MLRKLARPLSVLFIALVLTALGWQVLASGPKRETQIFNRWPAAFGLGGQSTTRSQISEIESIELPCLSENSKEAVLPIGVDSDVAHVRLKTQWCGSGSKRGSRVQVATSRVRNLTTGMEATVFVLPQSRIATDLMALAPGTNLISLMVFDRAGRSQLYQLEISRK